MFGNEDFDLRAVDKKSLLELQGRRLR